MRQHLAAAAKEQAGEAVQLELGPVEIEVAVSVTRESGGAGRIRLWVVDAEAEDQVQPVPAAPSELPLPFSPGLRTGAALYASRTAAVSPSSGTPHRDQRTIRTTTGRSRSADSW
ncbi:trypco2 family protein [Streptomyces mirabilis]|uniref:trypco2 family protein n=1 Tax=Streptomyces mirabilis TaxID=68239 RepID=UPI0036905A6E